MITHKVVIELTTTHRGAQHGPFELQLGGEAISYVDVTVLSGCSHCCPL